MEPWQQTFACFYPHGTIFIRPGLLTGWQDMTEPPPSRFLSGHFCFADGHWAKTILHDQDIYFSGEELNLTIRSYTHGYDLFHPHKLVVWHATMREERDGILVWDDQHKRGESMWWKGNDIARSRIRQLLGTEDNGHDLGPYGLGTVRTVRDYEKYAGIHFKKRAFQKWTVDDKFPPNPQFDSEEEWEESFMKSFYHLVNIDRHDLPENDYDFILVAYDDEDGLSIFNKYIDGHNLQRFLNGDGPIHYEEMFTIEKEPVRVVYWAHSPERGWVERKEINLKN
jgi:hypothetical protein